MTNTHGLLMIFFKNVSSFFVKNLILKVKVSQNSALYKSKQESDPQPLASVVSPFFAPVNLILFQWPLLYMELQKFTGTLKHWNR